MYRGCKHVHDSLGPRYGDDVTGPRRGRPQRFPRHTPRDEQLGHLVGTGLLPPSQAPERLHRHAHLHDPGHDLAGRQPPQVLVANVFRVLWER